MANMLSNERVINAFRKVHGDRYDYSKVAYKGSTERVVITCREHGDFFQRPTDHKAGSGCNLCALITQARKCSKPASHFIEQARSNNKGEYDYSLVPPSANGKSLVSIICKKCGRTFSQKLSKHAAGHGCSKCQDYGFCEGKPGYVYLLNNADMFKVGITNRKVDKRVREVKKGSNGNWVVLDKFLTDGYICRELEGKLLSIFQNKNNLVDTVFSGYTETFYCDDTEFVKRTFADVTKGCPILGELHFVKKPPLAHETPEKRRVRLEAKTGLPVGVVKKYGRWYFQEIVRLNGVKEKVPRGSFIDIEDCKTFARHYWETGELLDTNKNLMVYNNYGLPKNILPCFGGFRVQFGFKHKSYYIGTFGNLDLAKAALHDKMLELLNG